MTKRIRLYSIIVLTLVCIILLSSCSAETLVAPHVLYDGRLVTWHQVKGAVKYEIEVDGEIVGTTAEVYYPFVATRSLSVRVRALDDKGKHSAFSQVASYTVPTKPPILLGTPSIIEINGDGRITWRGVENATGYRIWVNNKIFSSVTGTTSALLELTPVSGKTSYVVQVQAVAGAGYMDSNKSTMYRVETIDGIITPPALKEVTISYESGHLLWKSVANAVGYRVMANGMEEAMLSATDGLDHRDGIAYSYPLHIAPGSEISYHVIAVGNQTTYRNSAKSNALSFPLPADNAPRLSVSREQGAIIWEPITHCNGYEVVVYSMEGDVVRQASVSSPRYTPSLLADGRYQVRVRGKGDFAYYRPTLYSESVQLEVADGDMALRTLSTPEGVRINGNTLKWDAVEGAITYQVALTFVLADPVETRQYTAATPQWTLTPAEENQLILVYVTAHNDLVYKPSSPSAGVYIYPADATGEHAYSDATHPAFATPTNLSYDGYTFRWNGTAPAYELVLDETPITVEGNSYEQNAFTGAYKLRAKGTESILASPYTATQHVLIGTLDTPVVTEFTQFSVCWDAIHGAHAYKVFVDGNSMVVNTNQCSIKALAPWDGVYEVCVMALSDNAMLYHSRISEGVLFTATYEESGTEHKPYTIATLEDLSMLNEKPYHCYALSADIDIGTANPLMQVYQPFGGILDGKGHTITATLSAKDVHTGVLGNLVNATVRNVTFRITVNLDGYLPYLGGVADNAVNTLFDNVSVHINGTFNAGNMGSLVGAAEACTFRYVSVTASLEGGSDTYYYGGITGEDKDGTYLQCTADSRYQGAQSAGGMVGSALRSTFNHCETSGYIEASSIGGVAGVMAGGEATDCVAGTASDPLVAKGESDGVAGLSWDAVWSNNTANIQNDTEGEHE